MSKTIIRRSLALAFVIPLPLFTTACFHDDGNEIILDYNSSLKGTYLVQQAGENSNGVYIAQIEVTSNGNGSGNFNILRHSQGHTTPSPATFTYNVSKDGTFSVNNGGGDDSGIVSQDGSLFVIVDAQTPSFDTDGEAILSIGIKKNCTTAPVLSGDYQIGQIAVDYSTATPLVFTSRVDISMTSSNTGTFTIVEHSLGHTGSGDFTLATNSDCTIVVNNGLGDDFGIASKDGSLFALVDADETGDSDNSIVLAIGVKKSTGLTNSSLTGDYFLGQMGQNTSGVSPANYTSQVNIYSQGDGTGNAFIAQQSLGNSGVDVPFTYSVDPIGTYSANNGGGTDYGIISSNGEFFIAVDASQNVSDNDNEIVFAAAVKKFLRPD